MKKISTLILASLCLHAISFSQKNLKEGYILKNNNDTVRGFIDYKEWYKNPNGVSFTQSRETSLQHYKINEVSGFGITGKEYYQRYMVSISMDRNSVGNINEKDSSSISDSVFLKLLQQGKNVTLLSYADDIKQRFYVLTSADVTPVELKNSKYISNGQFVSEKEYRSVLLTIARKYAPNAADLQTAIYKKEYSKKDILDICYSINGLNKDNVTKESKNEPDALRFYAGVGINNGTIKFEGENHYEGNTNGSAVSPLVVAGMDVFINPNIGRMFLRTQLSYTDFKTDAYIFVKYYEAKENYYLKFKQTNIGLHESLNYNIYNSPDFKFFIGAGVGINFSSYPLNEEKFIKEGLRDTTTSVNSNYVATVKKVWFNTTVKLGIGVRNFEVSVAYLPKSSISQYSNYSVANSSVQLQVNYLFKK